MKFIVNQTYVEGMFVKSLQKNSIANLQPQAMGQEQVVQKQRLRWVLKSWQKFH